ncbi:MAG TPA: hypothetical protein VMW40_03595 [Candidatus Bathyarchaeia archaeon]|nr:hypothetical protein [Candidatus Bathyarchaeia archaeon]
MNYAIFGDDKLYFSDRELGTRPRIKEEITLGAWGGLVVTINQRFNDDSFGYRYPDVCPDGNNTCGCDRHLLFLSLAAKIPDISLPLDAKKVLPTLAVLDFLEFCHRAIGKPIKTDYHSYFGHYHLHFEPEEGQAAFRDDINRIFSRNGIAYELGSDGLIVRLAPEGLREALMSAAFRTGDTGLDSLLEAARAKYLNPNLTIRQESLEKLWDAWERLKTVEPGKDKRASITTLLNKAATESTFRETLNKEASELTRIGNIFRIRHSEITQVPLERSEHVDYLFHRLFALILLFLRTTGRSR